MIIITLLQYKSRSTSLNIRFVDWLMSFSSLLLVVLLAVIVKAKKKERDNAEICRHCRLTLLHNNNSISRRLVQVRGIVALFMLGIHLCHWNAISHPPLL